MTETTTCTWWLVSLYVGVLFLVAVLPWIFDIFLAYYSKDKIFRQLLHARGNSLQAAEFQELVKEFSHPPPGITGLARTAMALTVIVILGIAVIHILINKSTQEDCQVINNILSMLAGLLAAITGFYYGGRTAEKKTG